MTTALLIVAALLVVVALVVVMNEIFEFSTIGIVALCWNTPGKLIELLAFLVVAILEGFGFKSGGGSS